jgi:putative CocE/NonD family hydrolase
VLAVPFNVTLAPRFYDGWQRRSLYVPVRDGTLLAVDIFRPMDKGNVVGTPLPVLYRQKRYQRAIRLRDSGTIIGEVYDQNRYPNLTIMAARQDMREVVQRGYVIVTCDMRGTGASFGTRAGVYRDMSPPADAWDGRDIITWIAEQPWCDGNVGMYGLSYEGRIQLEVAATAPAALRAIMPEAALVDWYQVFRRGGIFEQGYDWPGSFTSDDVDPQCAPVDDDPGGVLLRAAQKMHESNGGVNRSGKLWSLERLPHRDSWDGEGGRAYYLATDGFRTLLPEIARAGIAVHHIAGWFSLAPRWHALAAYRWLADTGTPQRLLMGDWGSMCDDRALWLATTIRFFDHWLKGIDTGLMQEPPILTRTVGGEWRRLTQWPPTEARLKPFWFGEPRADGSRRLETSEPTVDRMDRYTADYSISTAYLSVSPTRPVDDFAAKLDAKALCYTSGPLTSVQEVAGHPIASLYVSTDAEDVDLIVFLEDVSQDGTVAHVTEGRLRASHRALANPPFPNDGRPWHRSFAEDISAVKADEPMLLAIEMLPTDYRFAIGHCVRISICCAHAGLDIPRCDPPPTIALHNTLECRSQISLPIVGA